MAILHHYGNPAERADYHDGMRTNGQTAILTDCRIYVNADTVKATFIVRNVTCSTCLAVIETDTMLAKRALDNAHPAGTCFRLHCDSMHI